MVSSPILELLIGKVSPDNNSYTDYNIFRKLNDGRYEQIADCLKSPQHVAEVINIELGTEEVFSIESIKDSKVVVTGGHNIWLNDPISRDELKEISGILVKMRESQL